MTNDLSVYNMRLSWISEFPARIAHLEYSEGMDGNSQLEKKQQQKAKKKGREKKKKERRK